MPFSSITKAFDKPASDNAGESDAITDWTIIQSVQNGDVGAFDQLVVKYRKRVYSIIYNLTSNQEDAADLTQECFIKSFRSINRFKGNSAFFTWIYRIAVNTTLTHLRKNRFKRFFSLENLDEEGYSEELFNALSSEPNSQKSVFLTELQEKLNEALQTLSTKHRTVIILFEIEGLNHLEIAKILKCSEGTVRSRLHYAKKQLQGLLQDYLK